MELKKSISDTERALRSYGAVSETAWTTDKGEGPAVGPGDSLMVELGAVKGLNGDSRRAGVAAVKRPIN